MNRKSSVRLDPEQRKLFLLLGDIYSSARNPEGWAEVLKSLLNIFDLNQAAFLVHDLTNNEYGVQSSLNIDEVQKKMYIEYFGDIDVLLHTAAKNKAVGRFYPEDAFLSAEEYHASEFFNDYMKRFDTVHQCGVTLKATDTQVAALTLLRSGHSPRFTTNEISVLDLFVPHLEAAVELQKELVTLRSQTLSNSAFDGAAAFVLNQHGRIESITRQAEDLFCQFGIRIVCGELIFRHLREDERWRAAVRAAGNPTITAVPKRVSIFATGSRFVSVSLFPLVDAHGAYGFKSAILGIASTQDCADPFTNEHLRKRYGLSTAESRVARQMIAGLSLTEAANESRTTLSTIRSQLKSIFAKTGTKRQAELVVTLLQGRQ